MKRKPKQYFPIRLEPEMHDSIRQFSARMGRERSDVIREALDLGMGILAMAEYYTVRLNGIGKSKIMDAFRRALQGLRT